MYKNIPKPFPDECLRGYGFRVNASNGKDLLTASELLPELSKASGLSIPHLVTNHSHLAYTRFAHSTYGYLDIKNHPDIISNRNIANGKTPVRAARYCPNCAREDFDLFGASYWHRVHHLPGVDHCIKHGVTLINANALDGYTSQPIASSTDKSAIPENRRAAYFGSAHIKKFSYLSAATLEMGLSFEYFIIRNSLINQHKRLKQGPYFNLSELTYGKFPPFWLNELFFGIDSDEEQPNSDKIFEALKGHCSIKPVKAYLILMALFWTDPREAIRECLSAYYSRPLEDGRAYFIRNKYGLY